MRAEIDELGTITVFQRRPHGARVHTTVDGVHDESTEGFEIRNRAVDQPSCAVGHLENIHEHERLHSCIPGLGRRLNRVYAARATEKVRTCMYMNVDGALK